MNRGPLVVIAIILAALMVVVARAGLDDLPREQRSRIAAAQSILQADRQALQKDQQTLENQIRQHPDLFEPKAATFRQRLIQDNQQLEQAAALLPELEKYARSNRRSEAEDAKRALTRFDQLRRQPLDDTKALIAENESVIYDKLHPFDREAATEPVRKAMNDWPGKRDDLAARLEKVNSRAAAAELNALAAQLYFSWDKVLLDVNRDDQKVRIVRTAGGESETEERTEPRTPSIGQESEGLVIEHKPAGKYDSEIVRSPQPPAYAYMAPPGQSNHYGSWSNGVWHWLPQYLLLSQLLHSTRNPVVIREHDYSGWHTHRTVPPPVATGSIPKPPSQPDLKTAPRSSSGPFGSFRSSQGGQSSSGWWKERPRRNDGGSFDTSKYRSRGSFSGSRFQRKGTFRSFGRGRR